MTRAPLFAIASATVAAACVLAVPGSAQTQRISARYNAPLKVSPNPQARILATVPRGSTLVLDYCNANEWCRVSFRNTIGWMAAVNLNLPAHHDRGQGTLRSDAALRAGPGVNYKKYTTVRRGTVVSVWECNGAGVDWCRVNANGRSGWIARALIDMNGWGGNPGPIPPNPGPNPGGPRSELQLFTGRNCTGNTYSTLIASNNVNYPVQSYRVIGGSGNPTMDAWHVCAGRDYTGICKTASAACAPVVGMSGVRSVRPLSGPGVSPPGGICTKEYAPVCARSGRQDRTFGNTCEANAAGYTIRYQGQCR